MKDYSFLSRPAYFETLTKTVELAARGERVIVAAMDIDIDEPLIGTMFNALCAAAQRGANVTLLIDAITLLTRSHGLPRPALHTTFDHLSGSLRRKQQRLQELRDAGGTCLVLNIPRRRSTLLQAGRSHIKGAVIGNTVFVGGCNLDSPEMIDVMLCWRDSLAAEKLSNWLLRAGTDGNVRRVLGDVDGEVRLGDDSRLLIDAGVPHQSLIYDEALELIDSAQEWIYMTCQYFPGGPTARHLAAAQARGVRIEIDYSHPRTHGGSAALHYAHQAVQRTKGLPRNFFSGKLDKQFPKLHAKVLASERAAMLGSHNYVIQGVRFGTAELALKSLDPEFSKKLRDFMHTQLAAFDVSAKHKTDRTHTTAR